MPTPSPDIWSTIIPLLSAILGGLIGSLSGLGAQYFTHHLNKAKESEQRRRQQFSDLVDLVLQQDTWFDSVKRQRLFDGEPERSAAPIGRARIMVSLHFPELGAAMAEFSLRCSEYGVWIAEAAQKKVHGVDDFIEGFNEANERYMFGYAEFQAKLANYGRTHIPV